MNRINAGTTGYLTIDYLDKAGQPATPAGISYRIECKTTGQLVRGDTTVTPNASVEIVLSASQDVAIINSANRVEEKLLTVRATYAGGEAVTDAFSYSVKNLGTLPA